MDALTLRNIMVREGLSVKEGPEKTRILHFERALKILIPPKNQSDRTNLKRVVRWVNVKCENGTFEINECLSRIIDYALEASGPDCRNSAAVFMSILKKELGYPN